ncbi:MAG: cohesin domain-containing protein [Phaeodactylibacter sp.]|uniref:cohesin domain-containing protein n=1 Tax=Phaeodactylibacter sp. TaxID=1940289 RepID=UPI0032ED19C4
MTIRLTFIIILMALLWSCQSDTSNTNTEAGAATAQAAQSEITTAAQKEARPQPSLYTPPKSNEVLFLSIDDQTAKAGETVCTTVRGRGFNSLLSMQYTVAWDPDVLAFKGLKDFGLPYLTIQNFGTTKVQEGLMPVAWIDNALKGVTVSAGNPLYSICFEAKASGQSSPVQIIGEPTAIEVVNLGEELIGLDSEPGTITVQ